MRLSSSAMVVKGVCGHKKRPSHAGHGQTAFAARAGKASSHFVLKRNELRRAD